MTRIRFEDLPSTNTPRNAENLNKLNNVVISPSEPTTGEEVWLQKGKNYINLEELTNYSLNETTGALEINNTRLVTPYIFLKAGTYTISCNVSRFAYVIYNKDKSFNSFVSWQTFPNKIILNSDCYIRVEIIKDYNGSEVINKTDITYLQLEDGEVATNPESYIEKKIYTKNDNGVYEEFYNEEGKQTIGNLSLNDNFTINRGSITQNGKTVCINLNVSYSGTGSTSEVTVGYLTGVGLPPTGNNYIIMCGSNTNFPAPIIGRCWLGTDGKLAVQSTNSSSANGFAINIVYTTD